MNSDAKSLRRRQAKRLVEQLLKRFDPLSQAALADWFGVNPSIISNALAESRSVGPQFVDGAIKAIGLKPGWFSDAHAESADFMEWVADKTAVRPPTARAQGGDVLELITGVGKELGLDFEAVGRLVLAMSVVTKSGGACGRDEVIGMVHAMGLTAPSTGTREIERPKGGIARIKR